jgi:hypothetical protein
VPPFLKDLAGLLAGLTVLVYTLGGAVLAVRLAFQNLPGEAVLAQLPRELLITVGVSQVFIPALVLAAIHAAGRLTGLWERLWRGAQVTDALTVYAGVLWWFAILGLAMLLGWLNRGKDFREVVEGNVVFWLVAPFVLGLFIAGAVFVRVRFRRWNTGGIGWRSGPAWLTLTIAYGVVAMVAAAVVAPTFPLLDAKACTTAGVAERGDLVGQTDDRLFLGEPLREHRRIAMLPTSKVDELFIGPNADGAQCDPDGNADLGHARTAAQHARAQALRVRTVAARMLNASNPAGANNLSEALRDRLLAATHWNMDVLDAAGRIVKDGGNERLGFTLYNTQRAVKKLRRLTCRLAWRIESSSRDSGGRLDYPVCKRGRPVAGWGRRFPGGYFIPEELRALARLARQRSATAAVRARRFARRAMAAVEGPAAPESR